MKNKWLVIFFIILFIILIFYSIKDTHDKNEALKDSVILVGKVEDIEPNQAATTVDVEIQLEGKIIHTSFSTYDHDLLDSLKKHNAKIWIRVSKRYPTKYVDYIKIYKEEDDSN